MAGCCAAPAADRPIPIAIADLGGPEACVMLSDVPKGHELPPFIWSVGERPLGLSEVGERRPNVIPLGFKLLL